MWLAAVLVTVAWGAPLFHVPTFDLDEALYRRLAEEMKISGEYFIPTWNGRVFYEKPPTYFWTIILASKLFDGAGAPVSIFSSRLPGFLFTMVTVAWLGVFWPKFLSALEDRPPLKYPGWLRHPVFPLLVYSMALFPGIGASSVLLDPMLTAFFTPVLLVLSLLWLEGDGHPPRRPTAPEATMLAIGIAGATAVKGLIGILLPAFAVFVHCVLTTGASGPRLIRNLWEAVRALWGSFAGVILFGLGFYGLVYWSAGKAFLYEFFVVHHFGRGAAAMQGHGGLLLYHPIVLLFGGTALSSLLLLLLSQVSRRGWAAFAEYAHWGVPFSWTVAFVAFYSASSTKLPNYTWPVWPAMSLGACILLAKVRLLRDRDDLQSRPTGRIVGVISAILKGLAYSCPLFLCALLLLIALVAHRLPGDFLLNPGAQAIWDSVGPWPLRVRLALILVGICILFQVLILGQFGFGTASSGNGARRRLVSCAMLSALAVGVSGAIVVPFVADAMVGPYARLAEGAARLAGPDSCLATVGPSSPTVSLHYRRGRINDCSPAAKKLMIGPVWKEESCRENNLVVVARDRYLFLCAPRS